MGTTNKAPAMISALLIALISYIASNFNASFDPLVISIIIGMFFGNFAAIRSLVGDGGEWVVRLMLPVGITLYGTQMVSSELGTGIIVGTVLVFSGMFGLTLLIARVFNLNLKLSILLASGLSVCGASAIAVISPLIGARKEDTSLSIISVVMLGLSGMIFYPMLSDLLALTRQEFNFLAGATLPMVGQVRVAAGAVCADCVGPALEIKLLRISFLIFLVTIAVLLSGKTVKRFGTPWFVVAFIALALLSNLTRLLDPVIVYLRAGSTFFLSAALAAIGLSVDFDDVIEEGVAPAGVIFLAWGMIILMLYLAKNLF